MKAKKILLCLLLSPLFLASCQEPVTGSATSMEPIVGPKGDQGDPGIDGKSVLTGEGTPNNELGNDGDSYIDTTTFDFYTKADGAWKKVGNIKGEKGLDGQNGFDGKDGNAGKDGKDGASFLSGSSDPTNENGKDGDLYVNVTTADIFEKKEGSWENIGNIKGEKGDNGKDAVPYFPNTFLPSEGGYLLSDKGSYAEGETIKLTAKAQAGYTLESVEVGYNGNTAIYTQDTGLNDLLTNGLSAKTNGYVFKPIFSKEATFKIPDTASLATIGTNGAGTYKLTAETYGTQAEGIALNTNASFVKVVGKLGENNKPATTIYVSGKSTLTADYFFFENVNLVLADNYQDAGSILEFSSSFAEFKNSTITISKAVDTALHFKTGNFAIRGVKINSEADSSKKAFLKTAVLFADSKENALNRVVVDDFTVNNVQNAKWNEYAGSIFKSYYDAPYFNFIIKNSSFGTADTKIGEVWAHFRKEDHISTGRIGDFTEALYNQMKKTALVEIDSTNIYSVLENREDDTYNFALFTFHLMENEDDSSYQSRDVYADILFNVNSSTYNGTQISATNVKYGKMGDVPFTTIYLYSDEWYGTPQINYYQAIYPYAQVDGAEATLANGRYPY